MLRLYVGDSLQLCMLFEIIKKYRFCCSLIIIKIDLNITTKDTINACICPFPVDGKMIESRWNQIKPDVYEFTYRPISAGTYNITVLWNGHPVKGKLLDRARQGGE